MPSLPPHPDSTLSPRRGRGISVIGTVGCKGSWLSRWNGVWVKLFNLLIRLSYPNDFKKFVAQGDAARDMGNWGQAEEMYQMALQGDPSAAPIWVQYGHALKEQDKLAPALEAYRTALRLDGDEHLRRAGTLRSGMRGLCFGVGMEKLPSLFASLGVHITATDAPVPGRW